MKRKKSLFFQKKTLNEASKLKLKNVQDIKSKVDDGKEVHWSNDGYNVVKDKHNQYLIVFKSNDSAIGLTWTDGKTLNGDIKDFYYYD